MIVVFLALGLVGLATDHTSRHVLAGLKPSVAAQAVIVIGTEHVGWDQPAEDVDELNRFEYAAYIDRTERIPISDVRCTSEATVTGFECSAPLPPLRPGPHTLELVAVMESLGVQLESPRSIAFSIDVSGVAPRRTAAAAGAPQPHPQAMSLTFTTQDGARLTAELVAGGLHRPVALACSPAGVLFVVEEKQIRVVGRQGVTPTPALTLKDSLDAGEAGRFVDIALHPAFPTTHLIYVLFVAERSGEMPTYRLARFRELNGLLSERAVLLDRVPADHGSNGGTIRFGPDGRLYVGVGDLRRSVAQNISALNGKILRFADNGTVPRDNPLSSPVFSFGHRAPRGLAWHPATGDLWQTDKGRTGDDELTLVKPNGDYGWPDERLASQDAGHVRVAIGRSTGSVDATFYASELIPQFRNDLFLASPGSGSVRRVRFDPANPRRVMMIEKLLEDRFVGFGSIVNSPDGALYVATANRSAGTDAQNDDQIVRIVPSSKDE